MKRSLETSVLLVFLVASAGGAAVAHAQPGRVAIVVRGQGVDAASVQAQLRAGFDALGYEVLSDDAVEAATAFGAAEGEALRAALGVDVLAVVETRRAEAGQLFVSVARFSAAGHQQQFGRVPRAEVASFAGAQLAEWARVAPQPVVTGAPPVAPQPVVTGAPPQPVVTGSPPVAPQPVVTGAPAPVAPVGPASAPSVALAVAPIGPAPTMAPAPVAMPPEPGGRPRGAGVAMGGALMLAVGLVGYIMTPILSGIAMCSYDGPCDVYALYGLIPFAGPWVLLDNAAPRHPWDEGQTILLVTLGLAQDVLLPIGILMLAIGVAMGDRDPSSPPPVAFDLAPTRDGAQLRLTGTF